MAVAYKDDYVEMDKMYDGQTYKMAANTLMTWPEDIDASRLYMSTQETKQSLTLLNPDVPRVSTGWENVLGGLNDGKSYKKLKGTWEIVDKIEKYKNGKVYTLVIHNAETNTWDMIEKPVAKNLQEKNGYVFNTEVMDSLKKGDVVTDLIIYKSTAYDDHMNYRYGKNAKVMFSTSTDTLEDAIKIRIGWARGVQTVETPFITSSVNNNHIPLNLYGDRDHYKAFPDIGEPIQDSRVFSVRPLNKAHRLSELQTEALMKFNPATDLDSVINEAQQSYIYDIDVRYNGKEEFPTKSYFAQLKSYYDQGLEYSKRMTDWAKNIKKSGDNYTDNVTYFKSIHQHVNDPDYEWCGKEKNKPIGYMSVEFKVCSIIGIDPGSKLAGRFGDKGVIASCVDDPEEFSQRLTSSGALDSILDMLDRPINEEERAKLASQIEFVPDSEMPYTDDYPVDIILNASGAIRRLNPGQIVEVDLNFCSEQIRKKVCSLPTMKEKEDLIFDYLGMINKAECTFFYDMYKSFDRRYEIDGRNIVLSDEKSKEAFIHDIEEHGFYIRKEHDSPIRYEAIKAIYERYDFIKPLPIYIDIFGTKRRRIIKDAIVGEKYMLIMKHNSNKNFSARSTFRVNRAGLPVKDTTKRDNRSQYSRSPVRIGEAYNLMSSISGRLLAEYNIFMRSSVLGKKSLGSILEAEGNPLEIRKLKIKDNYINANADILNAKLKGGFGIRLNFIKEGDTAHEVIEDVVMPLRFGKYTIYDSPLRKEMYNKVFLKFIELMESFRMVETHPGEKEEYAWNQVFELEEIKELEIPDEVKEMLVTATQNTGNPISE